MNAPTAQRSYAYFDFVMVGFVVVLLLSNLVGPSKTCELFGFKFGAGNIFFPFSYIFGDILTEVYGYARSRRVIWAGFAALIFASVMSWIVVHLPSSYSNDYQRDLQPALELVFGSTFRVVLASMLAFWLGEFANSYVMAKMKVWSQGKHLWQRTIGSTIVGQGLDSVVFYPLAFAGLWSTSDLISIMIFNWVFKVSIEVLATPITYALVHALKKKEHEDYFDTDTNFTPFSLQK